MKKGLFIVFEGLDGAGTTTQLQEVNKRLGGNNYLTQEPTPEVIGKAIRQLLHTEESFDKVFMLLLFLADRKEHTNKIKKLLEEGVNVLCDRYTLSSCAYQGCWDEEKYKDNPAIKFLDELILQLDDPKPDYTFFIDTTPEECMNRIINRGKELDRYETLSNLNEVRNRYNLFEDKFIRINGNQTVTEVTDEIMKYLETRRN